MTRVLIVEDEESFADPLAFLLRKEGFTTAVAGTGQDALEEFDRNGADIVLLDLMLPGHERHRRLQGPAHPFGRPGDHGDGAGQRDRQGRRASSSAPTTTSPSPTRRASSSPVSGRSCAAGARREARSTACPGILEAGPVRMDVERHVVIVDGTEVALPLKEFDLLEYLLRNVGRVLTRGQLIDRVWGADYVGDTKTLDVHVKRLRSKVETDPERPQTPRDRPRAGLQVRRPDPRPQRRTVLAWLREQGIPLCVGVYSTVCTGRIAGASRRAVAWEPCASVCSMSVPTPFTSSWWTRTAVATPRP